MFRRLVLSVAVLALASPARATWSVVGVDPVTREVGVAVATCVAEPNGSRILPQVAGVAPGVGALAAQAQFNQQTRDRALTLLRMGVEPQAILDQVNAADPGSSSRQYGIVTLSGGAANHTGTQNSDWAGALESRVMSVQGNILVGPEVVADAQKAFEQTEPCEDSLADKLLRALEAGAKRGGDSRCPTAQGALVAVLRVAARGDDGDAPPLNLVVTSPRGSQSPVTLLKQAYDRYRAENPPKSCTAAPDAGVSADAGSGARDAGASDASARDAGSARGPDASDGSPRDASGGSAVDAGSTDRGVSDGSSSQDAGRRDASVDARSPSPNEDDDDDDEPGSDDRSEGCSAARGGGRGAWANALVSLALLLLSARARRRRSSRWDPSPAPEHL